MTRTASFLLLSLLWLCPAFVSALDRDEAALTGALELYEDGKYAAAERAFDALIQSRPSSEVNRASYFYMGRAQEQLSRPDKAIGTYQVGGQLYPRDLPLAIALGTLYLKSDLFKDAEVHFMRAVNIDKDSVDAHEGLAETYERIGHLEWAEREYGEAIRLSEIPEWSLLLKLARCLYAQRKFADAEAAAARSLASGGADPEVWRLTARIRYERGRREEAIGDLDAALALAPKRSDIALEKALWLLSTGKAEQSLADANGILADDPENTLAHFTAGLALNALGRRTEAAPHFRIAAGHELTSPFIAAVSAKILARNAASPR